MKKKSEGPKHDEIPVEKKEKEKVAQETKEMQERIMQDAATIQELSNLLKHIQADFENYKKRVNQEEEEKREWQKGNVYRSIIPIMENLGRALMHTKDDNEFVAGVRMINEMFLNQMASDGIMPLGRCGEEFDPRMHQAVEIVFDESKTPNTVCAVVTAGYALGERVLIPAKVKVTKKCQENKTAQKKT